MQIRPTAFTIGLIIYSFIALFFVYTEFGIDSFLLTINAIRIELFFIRCMMRLRDSRDSVKTAIIK